jgi:hemerythrin-like domain-containing protein
MGNYMKRWWALVAEFIHHHHDNEEKIIFPWMNTRVKLPESITEEH